MNNKINYLLHKSTIPNYYHRQFDNDLPTNNEKPPTTVDKVKRVALLALPFLSLYKPLGQVISLTMGSARVISTGITVITADKMSERVKAVMQVGLATIAVAGALYQFTLGLYLTTALDILTNAYDAYKALRNSDYKRAVDVLLQGVNSALYLAIMVTGGVEILLASFLVQSLISFYQAHDEWKNDRIPETIAKVLMGMIRFNQANNQLGLIIKRNELMKRYEDLVKGLTHAKKIDHLADGTLEKKVDSTANAILHDANGSEHDFGKHIHGFGGKLVKGMNLSISADQKATVEFKINHVFREKLEQLIQNVERASQDDLKALLQLTDSHIEEVTVSKKTDTISKPHEIPSFSSRLIQQMLLHAQSMLKSRGETSSFIKQIIEMLEKYLKNPSLIPQAKPQTADVYEIRLKGVGTISIGATKDAIAHYNRVRVELDYGKNFFDMHEALSFLQLDDALKESTSDDILRMKIGHLFRIFDPQAATQFERTDPYFDLPIEEFQNEVIKRSPTMQEALATWLPKMQLHEMLPGKYRYSLDGLADKLSTQGALGLTAALTGSMTDEEMVERCASILKMGMLSSEIRNSGNFGKQGLSWGVDVFSGGSDSVFTQIVTDQNKSYNDFSYYTSKIRFLISPKIFETGTYQYHDDNFGVRIVDKNHGLYDQWEDAYEKRQNIFDFLQGEKSAFSNKNEVMIKDRIPPQFLTGIVVHNASLKENLINFFQNKEITFTKPLDEFIVVNDQPVTREQFLI